MISHTLICILEDLKWTHLHFSNCIISCPLNTPKGSQCTAIGTPSFFQVVNIQSFHPLIILQYHLNVYIFIKNLASHVTFYSIRKTLTGDGLILATQITHWNASIVPLLETLHAKFYLAYRGAWYDLEDDNLFRSRYIALK